MQKNLGFMILSAALVMPLAAHAEGSYFKAGVGSSERGFKYEVQHGLKIHETPGVGF